LGAHESRVLNQARDRRRDDGRFDLNGLIGLLKRNNDVLEFGDLLDGVVRRVFLLEDLFGVDSEGVPEVRLELRCVGSDPLVHYLHVVHG